MKIPYSINKNTVKVYTASKEAQNILNEANRQIQTDDLIWDEDFIPTLRLLCVKVIVGNFEKKQIYEELLPCEDFQNLIEFLPLNLPLEITIPLIDEEIYWERKFDDRFKLTTRPANTDDITWKNLYIQRHVEDLIEQAEPQYEDEISIAENLNLFTRYIEQLNITQLKAWKPPLTWDEEDISEKYPSDHIDFAPIFKRLVNLKEFNLIYGMKNIADNFNWRVFDLSPQDCLKLGKAISGNLTLLKVLKIHRSNLGDDHARQLMQGLAKNQCVEELDLSHCLIGDVGAICIAKFLLINKYLERLDLTNNKIGVVGAEALGYSLLQETCTPLTYLNLRLNPLKNDGAFAIMRALIRMTNGHSPLENLSLSATLFNEEIAEKFLSVLKYNRSLKILDISNNYFGDIGGEVRAIFWYHKFQIKSDLGCISGCKI